MSNLDITYHHSMRLDGVKYGTIVPSEKHTRLNTKKDCFFYENVTSVNIGSVKNAEEYDLHPNLWLQKETGFYPLFLSVHGDIHTTGYQGNWSRCLMSWHENGKRKVLMRKKGEFPNYVMFSFDHLDDITFIDYSWWFVVLNSVTGGNYDRVIEKDKQILFKRSWSKNKWIRHIVNQLEKSGSYKAMAIIPRLDLKQASSVWVRNNESKKKLEHMGFKNVQVKRVKVESIRF